MLKQINSCFTINFLVSYSQHGKPRVRGGEGYILCCRNSGWTSTFTCRKYSVQVRSFISLPLVENNLCACEIRQFFTILLTFFFRDLKPENILLDDFGKWNCVVKLLTTGWDWILFCHLIVVRFFKQIWAFFLLLHICQVM